MRCCLRIEKHLFCPMMFRTELRDVDRFVVVMENDGLILKKVHSRRTLEEMVVKEKAPLSDERLNKLIHESRKHGSVVVLKIQLKNLTRTWFMDRWLRKGKGVG